jgi:hypothetical protein
MTADRKHCKHFDWCLKGGRNNILEFSKNFVVLKFIYKSSNDIYRGERVEKKSLR